MSVVLRCPTCGTTQGQPGECEACAEGEVRYFCTNHDQGIWLDRPVCSDCGATFGDPPRKPPAPRAPGERTRPTRAADYRPPVRRTPKGPSEPDFGRRPPRRSEPEPAEPEVVPLPPSLGEFLEAISERARARARHEADEVPWAERPAPRPGFPIAGCLGRIVGLVFLLIAVAVIFLFLLFAGFIVD